MFLIALFLVAPAFSSLNLRDSESIEPGKGYSSDSGMIAPITCYEAEVSSKSNVEAEFKMNQGFTFEEIQNKLGISVDVKAKGASMFSISLAASYLRAIEDKDYTFSINYYNLMQRDVSLKIGGAGQKALNDAGKEMYQDGENEYFRLVCGDQIINSFKEKALLMFSFNLKFKTHTEKQQFEFELGVSLGGLLEIGTSIESIAKKTQINAEVQLQALQVGGDPTQLSKIIGGKDEHGIYYSVTCGMLNMTNCKNLANGVYEYAREKFPSQVSFEEDKGLTSSGLNSVNYFPANYIGLKVSKSFLTDEIKQNRLSLSEMLLENQYYHEKLHQILINYPVSWNKTSGIYNTLANLSSIA